MTVELAHECWQDDEGQILFSVVGKDWDEHRKTLYPGAALAYVIMATCWQDAQQQHYDRQGWGVYEGMSGVTDLPYTDEQLAEQRAARKT